MADTAPSPAARIGIVVTSENAQDFYDANIKSTPELDWNDIWGRVSGQIQYS